MTTSISSLLTEEDAKTPEVDHHWSIAFSVRLAEPIIKDAERCRCHACEDDDDDEVGTIASQAIVAAGDNVEVAIAQLKAHVFDEEKFGVKVQHESFRIQAVRLASVREL